jgi:hypothetical protein
MWALPAVIAVGTPILEQIPVQVQHPPPPAPPAPPLTHARVQVPRALLHLRGTAPIEHRAVREMKGMADRWKRYRAADTFDELVTENGHPRQVARPAVRLLRELPEDELAARRAAAEVAIREMGISFTVYSEAGNIDRAWPFDLIPRVITAREWARVRRGLEQRSRALNLFINDVYNRQKIFADGVIPAEIVLESGNFKPQCLGASPRFGVWAHVCGSDLIRNRDGQFYVLEDNLRVPSGVSYMVENREITKRVLPELFEKLQHSARRRVPDAAVPHARGAVATGPQAPDDRGPHAGHLQLRVLRARLPGPGHGCGAGRGRRPVCRR